ncbi:uncharacterized protein BT62DRAFT_60682 [Guyanagaster necrorhizus]|uniref:F-box domain-containing protein n=1 Tax=Guyanagaster necrorhizus TaxID=856835 RepID=A0A9P7VV93_9AGAR|nr:uncharacterized protein BT62DRAFT_60682 [Guyanagaster necrorhizus MCA 3950]KAG7447090.1 hypothetical protein BT62DRAFT_60682 [Guyanagaster necrorhizus MCA 3950]
MQETTLLNPGQLPEDIIVSVFHELQISSDAETLSSCAVVCRSWSRIAQDALFARFDIILEPAYVPVYKFLSFLPVPGGTRTIENFIDFVSANPRISHLARNLRFRIPAKTSLLDVNTNVGPIFSVLRHLHKLRSLSIDAKCFCGIAPDAILSRCYTMTKLSLRDVVFPHVGKLMELICCLPMLEDLTLIGSGPAAVFEESIDIPWALQTVRPPLRRLVIHMGHTVITSLINDSLLCINGLRHLDILFVDGLKSMSSGWSPS